MPDPRSRSVARALVVALGLASLTGCAPSYPSHPACPADKVAFLVIGGVDPSSVTAIGDFEAAELLEGSTVECAARYEVATDTAFRVGDPEGATYTISFAILRGESTPEAMQTATAAAGYETVNPGNFWQKGEAAVNFSPISGLFGPDGAAGHPYILIWSSDGSAFEQPADR